MEQFTKSNLAEVRSQLESVLEVAADQLGIVLSIGSISYQSDKFTVRLTGIAADGQGNLQQPYEKAYNDKKTDDMLSIGDTFVFNGETFTVAGWKPRSKKYPLLGKNAAGKMYKFAPRHAFKSGSVPKWMI